MPRTQDRNAEFFFSRQRERHELRRLVGRRQLHGHRDVAGGQTQVVRAVAMDRFVRIREGDDHVVPLSRRSFVLGGATRHKHAK